MSSTPRLFPTDFTPDDWVQFRADGYDVPVDGVIYTRQRRPEHGMPLGGIDTGRLDLRVYLNHLAEP